MRRTFILSLCALSISAAAFAQPKKPNIEFPEYEFTVVKENPVTSVKNQYRSGTCWSFSGIGFLEAEAIRIGGIQNEADYPDFSEFYVISKSYQDRADKYVRLDGKLGFSSGSSCDDVLHITRDYGIVPQIVMSGMNYGTELPVEAEVDAVLLAYVEAVSKNPNRELTTAWKRGFKGVCDAYFGECPETFTVDGKEYTPASYRDSFGLNPDDYVSFTSFTHHPFYTRFAVEVCDNWRWDKSCNVPLDELMEIIDNAIMNGYTIAWGADVSEPGFTRDGLGVYVDLSSATRTEGSDQIRWVGESEPEKAAAKKKGKTEKILPPKELPVSQESRQNDYDRKNLTDDHGMLIYGIAKDQFGTKYYIVKNSWGTASKYAGIWYITETFVKARTMDFIVHKDAVPQSTKDKFNIK